MSEVLTIERKDALPPLSWFFCLGEKALVSCGNSVLTRADGFFEGAWAHNVDSWNFDRVSDVFGSGAHLTPTGWIVVPPSHTLECLYLLQSTGNQWSVSNSLTFLLTMTGAQFKISGRQLSESFIHIVDGIAKSPFPIPTDHGILWLLYHHNAILGQGMEILPKPIPPTFDSYEGYRQHLQKICSAVARNAGSPERSKRYSLLATISSGYDSPACATIARGAGCTDAITFRTARGGLSDEGTDVGHLLGLRVTTVERLRTSERFEGVEAEFLATGMQAEDFVYTAFADLLPGRVLVTGFHGDKVWDLHGNPNDVIKRGDISGSSLGEFRLSSDFVHLPMPFVGAQRHADMVRISNSPEMRPYCIGGAYDRPIPRRIAEDAGVSRKLFGQSKKAVSILLFRSTHLISETTRCAIRRVIRASPSRYSLDTLRYWLGMAAFTLQRIISRTLPTSLHHFLPDVPAALLGKRFAIYEHTHPFMSAALEWALAAVSQRYRAASSGGGAPVEPGGALDMPIQRHQLE